MYTIDELAHTVGMPSRTIRFYNTQGLLPPPVMQGRVAYYDDQHVTTLHLIKELKERQNLPWRQSGRCWRFARRRARCR